VGAESVARYDAPESCDETNYMTIDFLSLVGPEKFQETSGLFTGIRESRIFRSHTISFRVSEYTNKAVDDRHH